MGSVAKDESGKNKWYWAWEDPNAEAVANDQQRIATMEAAKQRYDNLTKDIDYKTLGIKAFEGGGTDELNAFNNNLTEALKKNYAERDSQSLAMSQKSAEIAAQALKNRSLGLSRSAAADVGNQTNNYSETQNALQQGLANQFASTQADYLEKQGYVDALQQQAGNLQKGKGLAVTSAVLQGMSDENEKVAPDDDTLLKQVDDYKKLYAKLQQLKGGN